MARDRFIRFAEGLGPSNEKLQEELNKYFQESGKIEWFEKSYRFFVSLKSHTEPARWEHPGEERYIEIFRDVDYVDVITRMADDFTNAVANGCARRIARVFYGNLEE